MNKENIAEVLAEKHSLNKKDSLEIVNTVFETVKESLVKGEAVSIVNFGKFERKERKERVGRNPQTGEEMTIKAQKTVGFKAGKALKDEVKGS